MYKFTSREGRVIDIILYRVKECKNYNDVRRYIDQMYADGMTIDDILEYFGEA